jgi:hypothetical protein
VEVGAEADLAPDLALKADLALALELGVKVELDLAPELGVEAEVETETAVVAAAARETKLVLCLGRAIMCVGCRAAIDSNEIRSPCELREPTMCM